MQGEHNTVVKRINPKRKDIIRFSITAFAFVTTLFALFLFVKPHYDNYYHLRWLQTKYPEENYILVQGDQMLLCLVKLIFCIAFCNLIQIVSSLLFKYNSKKPTLVFAIINIATPFVALVLYFSTPVTESVQSTLKVAFIIVSILLFCSYVYFNYFYGRKYVMVGAKQEKQITPK